MWNVGTWSIDVKGEAGSGTPHEGESTEAMPGAEPPVVALKSLKGDGAKGWCQGPDSKSQPTEGRTG